MSLINDLNAALQTRGRVCRVEQIVSELGDDGPELLDALKSDEFPLVVIVNVLADRGIVVSADSLRKHRQGRCRCVAEG